MLSYVHLYATPWTVARQARALEWAAIYLKEEMDVTTVKFSCRAANVYLGAQEELGRLLKETDQNF